MRYLNDNNIKETEMTDAYTNLSAKGNYARGVSSFPLNGK